MSVSEMPSRSRSAGALRFPRRRAVGLVLGAVMLVNVGCYTYQPLIDTRPQPGQDVSLELSDQGRAALGGRLGPGVLRVEGTLQGIQNDRYTLSVSRVTTIEGGTANWGGEHVDIPVNDVSRAGTRTLSRGRTALLVGVAIVGVGVFAATRSLLGGGFMPDNGGDKGPPAGTDRTGY
ncbi:MAG TPA: hypothetical protein VHB25_16240 [Gemmatimonadaceae bacterium]|nr:hypothetical protein [Gemmatimonadaceae bacterium]